MQIVWFSNQCIMEGAKLSCKCAYYTPKKKVKKVLKHSNYTILPKKSLDTYHWTNYWKTKSRKLIYNMHLGENL